MFRMIRRAPWIALGAAGAYYLDARSGAARRERLTQKAKDLRREWLGSTDRGSPSRGAVGDSPLAPNIDWEVVEARSHHPQAEELRAGVPSPAPTDMAQQIIEESERRLVDRAGVTRERRTSQDTVTPPDADSGDGGLRPRQPGGVVGG